MGRGIELNVQWKIILRRGQDLCRGVTRVNVALGRVPLTICPPEQVPQERVRQRALRDLPPERRREQLAQNVHQNSRRLGIQRRRVQVVRQTVIARIEPRLGRHAERKEPHEQLPHEVLAVTPDGPGLVGDVIQNVERDVGERDAFVGRALLDRREIREMAIDLVSET